jgi:two-component system cell cycle sensor histidine kinase/response regulator CckA
VPNRDSSESDCLTPSLTGSLTKRLMRILIADDDRDVLNALKLLLTASGYEVLTAENRSQALNTIGFLVEQSQPLSLMVTEVRIWDMSGLELTRSVRKLIPDLSVIFMTGSPDDHFRQEIGKLENCGYVEKPFAASTLSKVISETKAFAQ